MFLNRNGCIEYCVHNMCRECVNLCCYELNAPVLSGNFPNIVVSS